VKNGARAKKRKRVREKMELLADKSLDFEKLHLPVNRAHDWLGYSKNLNF